FFTRLGSAVVFAAIMMGCLLWNSWTLLVLVSVVTVLCLREFFRIIGVITNAPVPSWLNFMTIGISLVMLWLPPVWAAFTGFPPNIAQAQYLPPLLICIPLLLLCAGLSKHPALV